MLAKSSGVLALFALLYVQVVDNLATVPDGQVLNCANLTERSPMCSSNSNKDSGELKLETSKHSVVDKRMQFDRKYGLKRRESYPENNCSEINQEMSGFNTSLVCSPTLQTETQIHILDENKTLKVFIQTPNNETQFDLGSSITIKCRFKTSLDQDLQFSLRWLRSVLGSQGSNQSITNTDIDSTTIIAATTRVWTVQRNGGLDLELNDFQEVDVGEYFCQAISTNYSDSIISEAKANLSIKKRSIASHPALIYDNEGAILKSTPQVEEHQDSNFNDNLSKLLPSLQVIPEFSELGLGEKIQLICTTNELDPDPEPSEIEWTFEPVLERSQLLYQAPRLFNGLPSNVSVLGNILMLWSMTDQHSGIYKCTHRLPEFNLSVQAAGEVVFRLASDSAPLVFVSPELVRVSPNKSITIQCEVSGYPPPEITWYRVDESIQVSLSPGEYPSSASVINLEESSDKNCLHFEQIPYKDTAIYCKQQKCISQQQNGLKRYHEVTGISLIHLKPVHSQHQGQYVCRATNKHGSNQASSVIDVEFKELPIVKIDPAFREQRIELNLGENDPHKVLNVTFKCSLEAGRPNTKLRWLRMINKEKIYQDTKLTNFDLYDLTKVSSATSKVTTWFENNGKSLILVLSTVSLDDEGDYVCLGENNWGRHSAVARLIVSKPLSVKVIQNSPLLAKVNESFHLECVASGHPIPMDIEWSRTDRGPFFSLITRSSSSIHGNQEKAILKFDRVSIDDSGEYTCNARNPINSSKILHDTIMVLVEEAKPEMDSRLNLTRAYKSHLPKLMVRPTRANAQLGSNITFDCLAVSGFQPTLVKWIAPPIEASESGIIADNESTSPIGITYIQPYYQGGSTSGHLLQFGSKLKILNVSKAHEGIYQCRGSNKIGVENAPALLKVIPDPEQTQGDNSTNKLLFDPSKIPFDKNPTKSKIAKLGSNIELKCQVNGIEQPATSWSREGSELPTSSVQIEHNLWIQNVSSKDNGLFICSARSKQPNKVIQAAIRLIVDASSNSEGRLKNLVAKIVASKSAVNVGDSITLECIVNQNNSGEVKTNEKEEEEELNRSMNLYEVERNVIWTNLHTGQTLFQDNVYVQDNLLIIYDLRSENSATYRCNYNELSQHVDYELHINDSMIKEASQDTINTSSPIQAKNLTQNVIGIDLKQIAYGSQVVLKCLNMKQQIDNSSEETYKWIRGRNDNKKQVGNTQTLVFESIQTEDADLYSCYKNPSNDQQNGVLMKTYILQVIVPVARFLQRPVSFITLPTVSGADHQLDIELKFLIERDTGLILFNGPQATAATMTNRSILGDYISLGLNRGHLEFRFELGDGTTLLRSAQALTLGHWHRVVIERNRRGAVMWLDRQPPVSNSSTGKFFNLNLDSVLYVGGHHHFMNKARSSNNLMTNNRFYGYSRGFQGCISLLRISNKEINLMARNRSVTIGIYECDKQECKASNCDPQNSICQVDHSLSKSEKKLDPTSRTSPTADMRCICFPSYSGPRCTEKQISLDAETAISASLASNFSSIQQQTITSPTTTSITTASTTVKPINAACELNNQACDSGGTVQCQSLTTTSFKCHCKLGYIGEFCAQPAIFDSETSVNFNKQAYVQLRFNKPEEARIYLEQQQKQLEKLASNNSSLSESATKSPLFNESDFARLTSAAEKQEISFKIQTKSSYGLIFYTGPVSTYGSNNSRDTQPLSTQQSSKSMVANLLSKLSNNVFDYLAIALVDGHVELSYELGSGVAIVRSSQRVNDGLEHKIRVFRSAKFARLTIDELHKYEGNSPGKLTMLNSDPDIYLGSLPHLTEFSNNSHMSDFSGCISELEINSLGPLNLIRSDQTSQLRSAQNLSPCKPVSQSVKQKPYESSLNAEDPDET